MVLERGCLRHQAKPCYPSGAKKEENPLLFNVLTQCIILLIVLYQKNISALFPARCRFYPTCSQYAKEALIKYQPRKAVFKILGRIFRCNPMSPGGYDPA